MVLLLLVCGAFALADTLTYFHDGANRRLLSTEQLGFSERFGLFRGSDPRSLDSLLLFDSLTDSVVTLTGRGSAGSELFDPLLNKIEGTNGVNSDHISQITATVAIPTGGVSALGLYRYEDRYSQMFDRYITAKSRESGLVDPASSLGLIEEKLIDIQVKKRAITSRGIVRSFGDWGVVPGFDSVYHYSEGYSVRFMNQWESNRIEVRNGVGFEDRSRESIRGRDGSVSWHISDLKTIDLTIPAESVSISGEPHRAFESSHSVRVRLQRHTAIGIQYLNELTSKGAILGLVENRFDRVTLITQAGRSIADAEFLGSILSTVKLTPLFTVTGRVSRSLSSEQFEESAAILQGFNSYSKKTTSKLNEQFSLVWNRRGSINSSAKIILAADQNPFYEKLWQYPAGIVVETVSPEGKSILATGVTGALSWNRPMVGVVFDGMIRRDWIDLPALSTNGFARTAVRIGNDHPRSFHGTATVENRAPVTHIRLDSLNRSIVHASSWNSTLSFALEAPVISPFLRKNIEPSLRLIAGPFYFNRDQQHAQLPGGNPIGPMIGLSLEGKILFARYSD